MKNINKAILVPVITSVALGVKFFFGYEIPDAAVDLGADLIMGLISLIGIFMNPKKNVEVAKVNESAKNPVAYGDHGPMV